MKKFKQFTEDMGAGAVSTGPTNVVGTGNIAGSGGKGGEPGVDNKDLKRKKNPVMGPLFIRKKIDT